MSSTRFPLTRRTTSSGKNPARSAGEPGSMDLTTNPWFFAITSSDMPQLYYPPLCPQLFHVKQILDEGSIVQCSRVSRCERRRSRQELLHQQEAARHVGCSEVVA